jgi:predicted enzyme related to lactoylglutathione lyase
MYASEMEGVPNHWMVYLTVVDCDAAAENIAASGGQIRIPPTEIPVGKFSLAADPQGAGFSIIALNEAKSKCWIAKGSLACFP